MPVGIIIKLIYRNHTSLQYLIINPTMSRFGRIQILRTKFDQSTTKQLLSLLIDVDWSQQIKTICEQLQTLTFDKFENRIMWMIGLNPSYFIQYQIDSYAIFKGYNKVMIAWKPKYLQYPAITKLSEFGQTPKTIKSLQITPEYKSPSISSQVCQKISTYIKNYYGMYYFNSEQQRFQKDMLVQIKNYMYRICKQSYWHCAIDQANSVDFVSNKDKYIKFRINGLKDKYDKHFVMCSQKGVREFGLRGKSVQVISFLAMLLIFLCVISCTGANPVGYCVYKDQMILGSSAVMLALMGMKVVSRNRYKKNLDRKIAQLEKQQKKQ